MNNTSSTSFEFRISHAIFPSIFLGFDASPQLHLSFLFPSVTDPLLSSIHSFLSLRATSSSSSLAFISMLSLSRSSLSRVGHGQRSASQPGAEVWQRRESGCASGTGARGGDCGKILMPATVCPPPVVLNHRYGESCSTSCFHAPRAFHRARKKGGVGRGKKVYH